MPTGISEKASIDVIIDKCKQYESLLRDADVRVRGDYRDNYSPPWKYNHWELKGMLYTLVAVIFLLHDYSSSRGHCELLLSSILLLISFLVCHLFHQ